MDLLETSYSDTQLEVGFRGYILRRVAFVVLTNEAPFSVSVHD